MRTRLSTTFSHSRWKGKLLAYPRYEAWIISAWPLEDTNNYGKLLEGTRRKKIFISALMRGSYLTSAALMAHKTTWTVHVTPRPSEFQDKKVRKLIKKNIPETLKRNRIAGRIKTKAEAIKEGKEKRWRRSKKWERKKINLRRKRKWEWKILSEIPREPR